MRYLRYLPISIIPLAILAWFTLGDSNDATLVAAASHASPDSDDLDGYADVAFDGPLEWTMRGRYELHFERDVWLDDQLKARTRVSSQWSVQSVAGERRQIAMSEIAIRGDDEPGPEELDEPFVIEMRDGRMHGLAFVPDTPGRARSLQTTIAAALHYSPGRGASWHAREEDLFGQYRATYRRTAEDTIRRTRAYTRLHDQAQVIRLEDIQAREETEMRFDRHGLVSAQVELRLGIAPEGMPRIRGVHKARLTRIDHRAPRADALPALPILPVSAYLGGAEDRASSDEALVDGADVHTLLHELETVGTLDRDAPDGQSRRIHHLRRMSALVRLQPESATILAESALVFADDRSRFSLVAGALAGANTAAGTESLTSMLDGPLPADARDNVLRALSVTSTVTASSVADLHAAVDGEHGAAAALALGAQLRRIGQSQGQDGDTSESAEDAVALLIARYQATSDLAERTRYLHALGNSGHPSALPLLRSVIDQGHTGLAPTAVHALRFIPGAEVDELLMQLFSQPMDRMLPAVHAASFRDPSVWRPRLEALRAQPTLPSQVAKVIDEALAAWNQG